MKKLSLSQQIIKDIRHTWIHRSGNEIHASVHDVIENIFPSELKPLIAKKIKYKNGGYRFIIHLPPNVRYKDFYEKLDYFRDFSGGEVEIIKGNRQKKGYNTVVKDTTGINIKIPRKIKGIGSVAIMDIYPEPTKFNYPYIWNHTLPKYNKMYLPCPIGYHGGNIQLVVDISKRHILIGGNTRNGKSNLLHVILTSLILSRNVMPVVIDMKRKVEFKYLHDLKHAIVASEYEEVDAILDAVNEKMNKRLDYLSNHKPRATKIQDLKDDIFPFILLVIDEMTELDEHLMSKVNRILRMGLASGIIVVGATQRASHKVTKNFTESRALFEWNLSFKCRDRETSMMVLNNDRAMYLPNKEGRCIFQAEDKELEIQVMNLPVEEAEKLLSNIEPKEMNIYAKPFKMLPTK